MPCILLQDLRSGGKKPVTCLTEYYPILEQQQSTVYLVVLEFLIGSRSLRTNIKFIIALNVLANGLPSAYTQA